MRNPGRISLVFVLLAGLGFIAPGVPAAEPAPPKRVLVLMPFQTSRPGSVGVLRGMEEGLKRYPGSVDIVADSVAPVPPEPGGFSARLSDWLAYKYGRQKFDAIVAVTTTPVPLAESLRDRLWPDAPILFLLQEENRQQFPESVRRSARVVVALDNTETLRSALQMLPSTRHLVFLGGASEADRQGNAEILGNIRHAYPSLDIIEITGLSWDETKTRVRSTPDHSIILIGSFFFDGNNREYTVPEQVEELSATAAAPIFADSDVAIGKGDVGGSVLNVSAAGVAAGEQLAELLKGADPNSLPVREVKNSFIVDWRQLKNWEISESTLPPGATILYRPPTAWEQYSRYISAFAAVFVLLLALVTFLLIERQRRKKEEELNSAMLESLPGLALLVNRQGDILRTNQIHSEAVATPETGSAAARPGSKYAGYLRELTGHEDSLLTDNPIQQVIAGSRASAAAELSLPLDRWIEIRAIQLPAQQSGSLIVHLDITQRKRAEVERMRSRTEIFHLNRVAAMGQLAASLAHELSQPLAAIMSNAEAAHRFANRANPDMMEIREALNDITRDDKRARAVIQGMRTMLKKETVVVEPVDLNQIATSVVQMIRNEATLRGVTIELSLFPTAVMVKGDQVALQQVVLNLASNGLDAMTDTTGERCLTIRTTIQPGPNLGTLWVQDNGPGVSAETHDKLFQPFFTTKRAGLGMGLSICQSIVESLNGRIALKQDAGQGAAFFVELPLAMPVQIGAQAASQEN